MISLGVSISSDYSLATRQDRKKLIEYGKSRGTVFKLWHNKLYLDGKCYMYDPVRDLVLENPAEQAISALLLPRCLLLMVHSIQLGTVDVTQNTKMFVMFSNIRSVMPKCGQLSSVVDLCGAQRCSY